MANRDKEKYLNPVGWWHVTTAGDCEGKSTRDLGTWYGHFADVAFHLADKQFYDLTMKKVERDESLPPVNNTVNIKFNIDSGTWDMDRDRRVEFYEKALGDKKDVTVKDCNYYAAVTLSFGNLIDAMEIAKNKLRKQALAKLTTAEKEVLDLL